MLLISIPQWLETRIVYRIILAALYQFGHITRSLVLIGLSQRDSPYQTGYCGCFPKVHFLVHSGSSQMLSDRMHPTRSARISAQVAAANDSLHLDSRLPRCNQKWDYYNLRISLKELWPEKYQRSCMPLETSWNVSLYMEGQNSPLIICHWSSQWIKHLKTLRHDDSPKSNV